VEQIVDLFDMLHKLGGPNGVIRQSEFFLYSEKDKEAAQKCIERNYRYPEITGWIRAVKEDFRLVKEMGLKETGILTSVSDYHIFLKLKKNRRVVLREYLSIVSAALDLGIVPRCHFEDITRAISMGSVSLCPGYHAPLGGSKAPCEDPALRYSGLWRALLRGFASPLCSQDHSGHDR